MGSIALPKNYEQDNIILIEKIEELRQRLVREAISVNRLDDEYIVQLSQELDIYILQYQKMTHVNHKINGKKRDVSK